MPDPNNNQYLYLVQHGEAVAESIDPKRPLSLLGRTVVEQVATWAAQRGVAVDQIRHSGKLRAAQTATIFADKLGPRDGVGVQSGLAPNDNVRPLAEALATESAALMLVGHLPFLSRLASLLVAGEGARPVIRFRNAGLVGLVREGEQWTIECVIPPPFTGPR